MTLNTTDRPRIVVGIDGSYESQTALRWAKRLASVDGADIEVITAWQFPAGYGWTTMPNDLSLADEFKALTTKTVREVYGTAHPEGVTITTVEANPSKAILDAAKDAYMIVVGSRGHGGFTGLLIGSVSERVAERAHCPVLVVHGDAPAAA
jgi:nucleotide-binding universal stress UspA family protein